MTRKVIVSSVIVEHCEDQKIPAYARLGSPIVCDTMEQAKQAIEDRVRKDYTGNSNFDVKEICRRTGNGGKLLVTVYYGDRNDYTEYSASEAVFK